MSDPFPEIKAQITRTLHWLAIRLILARKRREHRARMRQGHDLLRRIREAERRVGGRP
jgi:hypothetical protein